MGEVGQKQGTYLEPRGVGNVANGELRCRWCWKRIWSKSRSSRIMESLWRTDVVVVGSIAGSLVVVIEVARNRVD